MSCGYGSICTGCGRCGNKSIMPKNKRLCYGCGNEPPADAKYCPVCNRKLPPPFPPPPGKTKQEP